MGLMARRTFDVIDVTEILMHWHAGRSKNEMAASLCLLSHPAQPRTRQPGAQHLTDLSHRNLPERQPEPPSRLT